MDRAGNQEQSLTPRLLDTQGSTHASCRKNLSALQASSVICFASPLDRHSTTRGPLVKPPFRRRSRTFLKSTRPVPGVGVTSLGGRKSFTLMPTTSPSTVAESSTGSRFPCEYYA